MRLIGLCGYAGSGKDTAALALVELGWTRVAFADPLKQLAKQLGWNGKKDADGRRFLQDLGMAVREHVHPDAWIWAVADRVLAAPLGAVITDVRLPNEIQWIRKNGGRLVHIVRPGTEPANQHISELAWNEGPFDAVIQNDGSVGLLQGRLLGVLDNAREGAARV